MPDTITSSTQDLTLLCRDLTGRLIDKEEYPSNGGAYADIYKAFLMKEDSVRSQVNALLE